MCLSIEVLSPERVLAKGEHAGHQWVVVHNGGGFRCGYVRVDSGHPWHGKGYDDVDVTIHGGLTFSKADEPYGNGRDEGWWFGFDCAHMDLPDPNLPGGKKYKKLFIKCGNAYVRDQRFVESECRSLCEQARQARGIYGAEGMAS
jgi:hypothetical protein